MKILFFMGGLLMFISLGFMLLSFSFSKSVFKNRIKETPFECGFDPISSTRMLFSSRFFLIAVLFLVFDVEIVLLLPLVIFLKLTLTNPMMGLISGVMFLIILLIGLFYEWFQGALLWA